MPGGPGADKPIVGDKHPKPPADVRHDPETAGGASALSEAELVELADAVRATVDERSSRMRFPPPLEAIYQRETGALRERRLVVRGLVAVVLYDLFLLTDAVMTPDVLGEAVVVRLGVFTPLAVLTLWLTRRRLPPAARDALLSAVSLVGALGFVYIFTRSGHPNAPYYHGGLILVLTVVNLVIQLRFRHALAVSVAVLWCYALSLWGDTRLAGEVEGTSLMMIATAAAVTLFGNYHLEREQRLTYLLNLRERARGAELATDNRRLGRLATLDTLTALANRRALNMHLRRVVRRPRGETLSVLLIDIDHFKQYNDLYGHQRGDACLQRVAAALARVPTRSGDMVARFGGEEFVVVLPGTDHRSAALMAERLRDAVAALQIPHEASPVAPVVTVSVGVATAARGDSGDGAALLAAADQALYRAKSEGRNRVAA